MSVAEWLFRLNLEQYFNGFLKEKIRDVKDLRYIDEGRLEKDFKVKQIERKRMMSMI